MLRSLVSIGGRVAKVAAPARALSVSAAVKHTAHPLQPEETPEQFDQRFLEFFNRSDIDGWMVRKGMADLQAADVIPEPKIVSAALRACRRVNDYALAVRFLESVKIKCGPKSMADKVYPWIIQEVPIDVIPEPKIVSAALRACRRVNDYALAVRFLESVKIKFGPKSMADKVYPWIIQEVPIDVIPEPKIVSAALCACRRVNDYALAVRFLESVKIKCGPKSMADKVYPWIIQEVPIDVIPEPKIVSAALRACRRVNDYALAVRFLESVKIKCGPKSMADKVYPWIIQEVPIDVIPEPKIVSAALRACRRVTDYALAVRFLESVKIKCGPKSMADKVYPWIIQEVPIDVIPEPKIVSAALCACRRVNDYALAVRFLESVKIKCGPKSMADKVYPWIIQEVPIDVIPEPKIVSAALRACRRVTDYALAVRFLESVKIKCGPKSMADKVYPWIIQEVPIDVIPEPKIVSAALCACRRVNDYALAVRFLESVKIKCGPKSMADKVYPWIIQEVPIDVIPEPKIVSAALRACRRVTDYALAVRFLESVKIKCGPKSMADKVYPWIIQEVPIDVIPEPKIVSAALRACRQVNDYALAVRFLESVKITCGPKSMADKVYPWIIQEVTPVLEELGISTPEALGFDKPELFHPSTDYWEHQFYTEYGYDKKRDRFTF